MSNKGIRNEYATMGVDQFYQLHKSDYVNPHEDIIRRLIGIAQKEGYTGHKVINLCCGSGEVTLSLVGANVTGVDPYTQEAYRNRTGKEALSLSFKDIVNAGLTDNYDSIICSFALHLCPISLLPGLLWRLGEISSTLIVISPNKKPDCDNISGWVLVDEYIL